MAVFNHERTFGVEIEVSTQRRSTTIASMINSVFHARGIDARCEAQGYNHNTQSCWKVVPDGSVRGWEIVSPPMKGLQALDQISAVCKALKDLDVRVDRTTGLHVHHDARGMSGQAIGAAFGLYAAHHNIIDMMVAPSRRNTHWAQRFTTELITQKVGTSGRMGHPSNPKKFKGDSPLEAASKLARYFNGSRYVSMNIQSIYNHGTIEFRQHQGSIDATKIWNWILFTQSIIEAGVEAKNFPKESTSVGAKGVFNKLYGKMRISANLNGGNPESEIYVRAYKFMNRRFQDFCEAEGVNPMTMVRN